MCPSRCPSGLDAGLGVASCAAGPEPGPAGWGETILSGEELAQPGPWVTQLSRADSRPAPLEEIMEVGV